MTPEALDRVYPKMKRDFPSAELKPRHALRSQIKSGLSTGWLLQADGREAGYAFVLADPSIPIVLLDYLAVDRRGQGDGSAFLALLQQEYPQGMIVESEDEVPGDPDEENEMRRRRMSFYRRAGFRPCPFDAKIFGVRYLVHLWLPENEFAKMTTSDMNSLAANALKAFYDIQGSKIIARRFVHIDMSDPQNDTEDPQNDTEDPQNDTEDPQNDTDDPVM